MCNDELHCGKDGRMRILCGPGLASLTSCGSRLNCPRAIDLNRACMKSYPCKSQGLVRGGRPGEKSGLHANHEPVPKKVVPTFRTPPGELRLGSFLISIKLGPR